MFHVKRTLFEQLHHEGVNGIAFASYSVTVDSREYIREGEGDALVTIGSAGY
jgi:hypothetical protein